MIQLSKQFGRISMMATTIATVAALTFTGGQSALAQQPAGPGQGGNIFRRSIGAQAVNACYTTNFGDVAAKALNMTAVDIRKAIVGGKTLQQIATDANVDYKTVTDAITTARNAEIDQSVKDGVITQDEATAMEAPPTAPQGGQGGGQGAEATPNPSAPETTPDANGNGGNRPQRPQGQGGQGGFTVFPDISTFSRLLQQASGTAPTGNGGGRGGFGGNTNMFNLVQPYAVVAQALSMKCTDLVVEMITPPGKSANMVATEHNIDTQAITDALVKAYKDAFAGDVSDGVITQDQSDTLSPAIQKAVDAFVGNPLPMGPQGPQATPTASS